VRITNVMTSMLDVRGLTVGVANTQRMGAAGEWGVSAHWCGRIAGARWRVGQREDDAGVGVDGTVASAL